MGMQIEVTLNYSDWWPNAGTQEIPSSWRSEIEGLTEEESVAKLEELIYDYTKDIMKKLADQGKTAADTARLRKEFLHQIEMQQGCPQVDEIIYQDFAAKERNLENYNKEFDERSGRKRDIFEIRHENRWNASFFAFATTEINKPMLYALQIHPQIGFPSLSYPRYSGPVNSYLGIANSPCSANSFNVLTALFILNSFGRYSV